MGQIHLKGPGQEQGGRGAMNHVGLYIHYIYMGIPVVEIILEPRRERERERALTPGGGGSAILWLCILVPVVVGGIGGTSARPLAQTSPRRTPQTPRTPRTPRTPEASTVCTASPRSMSSHWKPCAHRCCRLEHGDEGSPLFRVWEPDGNKILGQKREERERERDIEIERYTVRKR